VVYIETVCIVGTSGECVAGNINLCLLGKGFVEILAPAWVRKENLCQ